MKKVNLTDKLLDMIHFMKIKNANPSLITLGSRTFQLLELECNATTVKKQDREPEFCGIKIKVSEAYDLMIVE